VREKLLNGHCPRASVSSAGISLASYRQGKRSMAKPNFVRTGLNPERLAVVGQAWGLRSAGRSRGAPSNPAWALVGVAALRGAHGACGFVRGGRDGRRLSDRVEGTGKG
jgi:hypothetical protein